jgi:DDB1- and CUL4-associated factor 11
MDMFAEESSDEEYFPAAEEDEERDSVFEEEEEDDDLYVEEEYVDEEHSPQDDDGAEVERILLDTNPGLLSQIQQLLQHGIRMRARAEFDPSFPRERRPPRRIQQTPRIPYAAGQQLLRSGEFGPIVDSGVKHRRYEKPRNLTQFVRFRELGWKRESTIPLTKKWIPPSDMGKLVDKYERHVYSGQFSHDGSFFYTASQDFRCRMYQTPNPTQPADWKLYKVHPL